MTSAVFLDTNVIVYAERPRQDRRGSRAKALLERLPNSATFISQQVLSEYANVLVHPRKLDLAPAHAAQGVRLMARAWTVLPITPDVVLAALDAVVRWRLDYYDAQIWATAALNSIPVVLSEDFADGLVLGPVRFLDPFAEDSDLALLED